MVSCVTCVKESGFNLSKNACERVSNNKRTWRAGEEISGGALSAKIKFES